MWRACRVLCRLGRCIMGQAISHIADEADERLGDIEASRIWEGGCGVTVQ